nr:AAA family ATPase [Lachnospiraceae bacterium]
MKLIRCSIYQFGKLKEKDFDFADGINLIRGSNESGKTTLHSALAALFFGAEKGRGRAAKDNIYRTNLPWTDPQLYGGALEWEREGRQFRVERDLAKTPPRVTAWEKTEAGLREIAPADLPVPPSLSPYLYFNTLSFRQHSAAVEGALAGELRSHIVNLQGSGNENIDFGSAIGILKEKRRVLRGQLQPEAAARAAAVRRGLAGAQQADFSASAEDWDEEKERLADQEARARRLAEERTHLTRELEARRALLKQHGLDDREAVQKDLEKASVVAESMANYEECYADSRFTPGIVKLISYLTLPVMLLFFWLVVNAFQTHRFGVAAVASAGFFAALLVSLRFSRKQDALDAQNKNREVLLKLLDKYMPGHEAAGSAQEAAELKEFLSKAADTFDYLEEREADVQDTTEELSRILGDNQSISRSLEENLSRRMERERWEDNIRRLREEEAALQPVLRKNQELEEEIAALDLAMDTLADLSVRSAGDFGAPLTETASAIFREITGGRYQGIRVNSDLQLLAEQDHQLIPPESLSGGTMEQLYFSFRLAMVRLLWPDEPMPLFFDDSFAFYDDGRLTALLTWLRDKYAGQVFLFSCQEREETILGDLGIPFKKITLE